MLRRLMPRRLTQHRLTQRRLHSIDEIKDSNKIRDLLEPVVGHWIKIPGHSWYEEDEENRSSESVEYRIAHVVGAERWLGGDEFELVLDRLISVFKNKDYSALNVDFGTGEELARHKVRHLSNVTVIPEDKIELTINKIELEVINKFTWVIRKAQKTAKAAEKKAKKKKEKK